MSGPVLGSHQCSDVFSHNFLYLLLTSNVPGLLIEDEHVWLLHLLSKVILRKPQTINLLDTAGGRYLPSRFSLSIIHSNTIGKRARTWL